MESLFDNDPVVVRLNKQSGKNGHADATTAELVRNTDSVEVQSEASASNETLKLFDIAPDTTLKRKSVSIVSPLRYPGSKRRFASYVAEALRINNFRPKLFVEPFAGGLSVALQMLADNLVDRVGVGELDPLVADFWHCVFFETEWLIESINTLEVNLDTWHHYKSYNPVTVKERAIACIFLNRTNFSGILNSAAGPIGGVNQASIYKIGCRFTKATVIKRIRQAASYRDRIAFIRNEGWQETLAHTESLEYKPKDVFCYLDPPFYDKASKLYRHYFEKGDHGVLRDALRRRRYKWLLSYDAADEIRALYSDKRMFRPQRGVELLYTLARSKKHKPVKEIVVTNLPLLPLHDRVWRSTEQW